MIMTQKNPLQSFHHVLPRKVQAKMDDCLKKGGEAHKHAITLSSLEYSGDLSDQLRAFSSKMEVLYKHLQKMIKEQVKEPKALHKFFVIIDEKLAWFSKAEAYNLKGIYGDHIPILYRTSFGPPMKLVWKFESSFILCRVDWMAPLHNLS